MKKFLTILTSILFLIVVSFSFVGCGNNGENKNNPELNNPNEGAQTPSIVTYGEYPQTYVGDLLNYELRSLLLSDLLEETGKIYTTYTADDRGLETVKIENKEYKYNGNKYVLIENIRVHSAVNIKASTGDTLLNANSYFFKVEPIEVELVHSNTNTYITKKVLGSMEFSKSVFNFSWNASSIRSFLNNEFLIESGLNQYAVSTTIHNNVAGNYDNVNSDYSGSSTTDKIWLPSYYEINNVWNKKVQNLECTFTDFALATYLMPSDQNARTSIYLLRSEAESSNLILGINGTTCASLFKSNIFYGYRPVFIVK